MSQHNRGTTCTKSAICTCPKCCQCQDCVFDRRARSLYDGLRGRMAAKKWKSGERKGEVRVAKRDIPYTLDQFKAWLRVVLEDTPHCVYCNRAINIHTISPDHAKPVSRGGTLALANLRECCKPCNAAKGALLPGEFKALLEGLRTFTEAGRSDVMKRLRGGILHFGNKRSELVVKPILAIPAPKMQIQNEGR